jgi:alpha-1,6-mannosyltransferase
MAMLSYAQAPVLWQSEIAQAPRATIFFRALGRYVDAFPIYPFVAEVASRLFASNADVIAIYWIPIAVATVAMLAVLLLLTRHREQADLAVGSLLFRWSLAFAAAGFFAFPLFTQDLWLSAAWGRMIVSGVNPYHHYFTLQSLRGLPLDHFPLIMSYGPLWALIAGAVMAIARHSALVTAILFKGLIAAAWIGSLALIRRFMREKTSFDLCLATAVFGWAPLCITQFLAEGHNDIVMMFLALLWLLLLSHGRRSAPVVLVSSALCKYVTAPLFLIDAIHVLRVEKVGWRSYLVRLLLPAILGISVFAIFYRSPQFFDGLKVISKWHFLQPRDAISAIEYLIDFPLPLVSFCVSALFPLSAIYYCFVYFQRPTPEDLLKASIAIFAAICFTVVSHLWPWYMIWVFVFAAQLPAWWLSRFVIAVSVLVPFAVTWWISPFAHQMSALVLYGAALLGSFLTRSASHQNAA